MTTATARRLAALEKRTIPAGKVYVVWPGEDPPAKVGPRDAVVFVTFDGLQFDDDNPTGKANGR